MAGQLFLAQPNRLFSSPDLGRPGSARDLRLAFEPLLGWISNAMTRRPLPKLLDWLCGKVTDIKRVKVRYGLSRH